jgi:hypothetical protein
MEDDYIHANDAIKRTILDWIKDDSIVDEDGDFQMDQDRNDQRRPTFDIEDPEDGPCVNLRSPPQNQPYSNNQIIGVNNTFDTVAVSPRVKSKPDVELMTPDKFTRPPSNSDLSGSTNRNSSSGNRSSINAITPLMTEERRSQQEQRNKDFLLALGLSNNHIQKDIDYVLNKYGSDLTNDEFITHLDNVRTDREKQQYLKPLITGNKFDILNSSITPGVDVVEESSLFHNNSRSNEKKKNYMRPILNKTDHFIDLTIESPQASKVCEKDLLFAIGLDNNFEETDINAVFNKYGKDLTKDQFLKHLKDDKKNDKRNEAIGNRLPFPKAPTSEELESNQSLKPTALKNKEQIDKIAQLNPKTQQKIVVNEPNKDIEKKKRKNKNNDEQNRKSKCPQQNNDNQSSRHLNDIDDPYNEHNNQTSQDRWSPTNNNGKFNALSLSTEKISTVNNGVSAKIPSYAKPTEASVLKNKNRGADSPSSKPSGARPKTREYSGSPKRPDYNKDTVNIHNLDEAERKQLRYIVIDGSNVAFQYV